MQKNHKYFYQVILFFVNFSLTWTEQYSDDTLSRLIRRWKEQVEVKGGTRLDKLKRIYDRTNECFSEAKRNFHIVHDYHLKKWALQANAEIGLEGFKASSHWINNFKQKVGITDRQITHFVTKKQVESKEEIMRKAKEFVEKAKEKMESYSDEWIYNMDESGYQQVDHVLQPLLRRDMSPESSWSQNF